jgi:hypothetical protein
VGGEHQTAWHAKEVIREIYTIGDPDLADQFVSRLAQDLQDTTTLATRTGTFSPPSLSADFRSAGKTPKPRSGMGTEPCRETVVAGVRAIGSASHEESPMTNRRITPPE